MGKSSASAPPRRKKRGTRRVAQAVSPTANCPALAALTRAFADASFRDLCAEVTQCGELTERCDLSAQIYPHGSHLLCHDDVIGTRKVSFIYYLTDPDEDWSSAEGGALELYPTLSGAPCGTPSTTPAKELLPLADCLVMFLVEPGVSYHAVREVRGARARVSIQGWLHAPKLEMTRGFEHRGLATLQQLLKVKAAGAPAVEASTELPKEADRPDGGGDVVCEGSSPPTPTPADLEDLARWIAPEYLRAPQLEVMAERFAEDSYAVLHKFLRSDVADSLALALAAADAADGLGAGSEEPAVPLYSAGIGHGWEVAGPTHLRRHLCCGESAVARGGTDSTTAEEGADPRRRLGQLLRDISDGLFRSVAFKRWLHACTRLELRSAGRIEVRRFRPGLDYTVAARASVVAADGMELDVSFVMVNGGGAKASSDPAAPGDVACPWESEEVGGFECYLAADDDDDTPTHSAEAVERQEVYRGADLDGPLVNLPAVANALCLVMRDSQTLRFIKYLSRDAPSSRVDIGVCYGVDAPQSDSSAEDGVPPAR